MKISKLSKLAMSLGVIGSLNSLSCTDQEKHNESDKPYDIIEKMSTKNIKNIPSYILLDEYTDSLEGLIQFYPLPPVTINDTMKLDAELIYKPEKIILKN